MIFSRHCLQTIILIIIFILLNSATTVLAQRTPVKNEGSTSSGNSQDVQGGASRTTKPNQIKPPTKNAAPKTNRSNTTRSANGRTTDAAAIELAYWESIKDSNDAEDFKAYLRKYPSGQFIDLAKNRLNKLESSVKPSESPKPIEKVRASDLIWSLVVFEDRFDANIHQWLEESTSDYSFEVKEGKYIIEQKTEGGRFASRPIAINQTDDFKIECTLQKINGINGYAYGPVWGLKDYNNYHYFWITGDGRFVVGKIENGKFIDTISWAEPNIPINKFNSTNRLTIKKERDQVQYFINDNFVGKTRFEPFFGSFVGFFVWNKQRIAIEDLVVTTKR
jgi:hypothetical protein